MARDFDELFKLLTHFGPTLEEMHLLCCHSRARRVYSDGAEEGGRGGGGGRRLVRAAGTPDEDEAAAPMIVVVLGKGEEEGEFEVM